MQLLISNNDNHVYRIYSMDLIVLDRKACISLENGSIMHQAMTATLREMVVEFLTGNINNSEISFAIEARVHDERNLPSGTLQGDHVKEFIRRVATPVQAWSVGWTRDLPCHFKNF